MASQVHAPAVQMGFGSDTFLCSHFTRMYDGHGKLQEAMEVSSGMAPCRMLSCGALESLYMSSRFIHNLKTRYLNVMFVWVVTW